MIKYFLSILFLFFCSLKLHAKDLKIITTIKPIHSLIANIIDDNDVVDVMINGNYSPHNFALKPSMIRKIYASDAMILMDIDFETFMQSGMKIIPETSEIMTLSKIPHFQFLQLSSHQDAHNKKLKDYHIWLSPLNAIKISEFITDKLSMINPEKTAIYQSNRDKLIDKLLNTDKALKQAFLPIKSHAFMVFHNAYQYLIKDYGLNYAGAITYNPNAFSSIKQIKDAQKTLNMNNIKCIFKEPQFSNTMIKTITQDKKINIGILDPLGGNIASGKEHYFQFIDNLKKNLIKCLGNS